MIEVTKDYKSTIYSTLQEYKDDEDGDTLQDEVNISIRVDLLDKEIPFIMDQCDLVCGSWYSLEILENLQKTINKAIKVYKDGVK